mmetsp:Transcript_6029/g.13297  ORF Transcript_6029/g.13297 Transcript_6029/m.13297 type:complete len:322 (+) Transcript_6029:53-1018(+)
MVPVRRRSHGAHERTLFAAKLVGVVCLASMCRCGCPAFIGSTSRLSTGDRSLSEDFQQERLSAGHLNTDVIPINRRMLAQAALFSVAGVQAPHAALADETLALQQLKIAAEAMRKLQKDLPDLTQQGADGAEQVIARISGTLNAEVTVTVPAGTSAGVDIEGMVVTGVSRPDLGWKSGDFVKSINGQEVFGQEDIVKTVSKFRNAGESLRFVATRKAASPFVTLKGALEEVGNSVPSSIQLPEPQDVADKVQTIKVFASFVQDGQGKLDLVRPSVDALADELELYVAAPEAAKAEAAAAKAAPSVSESAKPEKMEEYVPLF